MAISAIDKLQQSTNQAAVSNVPSMSTSVNDGIRGNSSKSAFSSLAKNENQFLTLLTTQLKHQDPTNPTDSKSLTSELAQFTAVEQQVQTNNNLESLITLNESAQLSQSHNIIGKIASVKSNTLPLQSGKGSLSFKASNNQIIAISVADSSGKVVKSAVVHASGNNDTWNWDGKSDDGTQLPDGAYSVAVKTADTAGNSYDMPFLVNGKITGVRKGSDGLYIEMGEAVAPMVDVKTESTPEASEKA
ncbi:flagellar biosynthesis protein FlgD (plasmid) [Aristophania vespae]|uniref:Basal-body rod modification protein FlgD n=1 Tax=Aristophania vespae TaxID=2697033 RepID=A0A6P1NLI7_9PROT|nr:flagellar hook assembly protein FlgD [Aristophania vespae]QHI96492.1 flagellar biosynthesis protein FlgD [Aristophania vespae]UMM64821.1 Basal-body rod modification protein FlgD [Aristophania vespae]